MSNGFPPNPIPDPFPNPPFPDPPAPEPPFPLPPNWPLPQPLPIPPDWWRCVRLGPVSGRYEGERGGPGRLPQLLHLRVDIDPRHADSPVMDRVSGDFYHRYSFRLPGRPPISWTIYRDSWIVDNPTVTWSRCSVVITGAVRYWKGVHAPINVRIVIPWGTFRPAGPATVTFTEAGAAAGTYSCPRVSDCFRDLELEIDVAASVQADPVVPTYDTHSLPDRPAGLSQRVLTIEEAYREAGICVTIRPDRTVIDDSDPQFDSWTPAELHDVMETNFQRYHGGWPNWRMWGLLAGEFENPGVGGIMFDAAASFGGAGVGPDRQGFAVFREHPWFDDLKVAPSNDAEDAAMRKFLYTWVHEAGHAFNLLHSWNKGRPDSLSWMNYDWRYDNRHSPGDFWKNFELRFDDEELIHIRHGDRAAVIMGGDPWASGGHLEEQESGLLVMDEEQAPLELLVRSQGYFELMEPVSVELRLRNLLDDYPIVVDGRLNPEFGGVLIQIKRPDGTVVAYDPIMCKVGTPMPVTLQDARSRLGQDRYSELVHLSYGAHGHTFDQPGDYEVRAIYQGLGDLLIVSRPHRIRVGQPMTTGQDRLAYIYYSDRVGLALYLRGSQSPHLEEEMAFLTTLADNDTAYSRTVAALVAPAVANPFFHTRFGDDGPAQMVQTYDGDPERAIAMTDPVVRQLHESGTKADNLFYHEIVDLRASFMLATGDEDAAQAEMTQLREDLESRDVKPVVLDAIALQEEE